MLNIPEEIKELFRADNLSAATQRHIKLRFFDEEIKLLYPDDLLFPSDDLFPVDQEPVYVIDNSQIISESMTITESVCSSQNLAFGECCASMFEITVADVLMDLTGKEFMATVEIGGYEMAFGVYKVDSFVREQADRRRKKITAYDRMLYFDIDVADWYQSLTFPLTLKQFRDLLCAHVGITQVITKLPLDDMQITKTIEPEQLDGRKVLMAICELNGCFGNFDKTGRLTYKFLENSGLFPSETLFPDEELFPSEMTNAETLSYYKQSETHYEDYVVSPIDKVQIRQEEGDVGASYGPGNNCYVIQGNYLVYGKSSQELLSIAATVYDKISGRIYRPCHIVGPALPWLEVGDGIICYTTDDVIETYCLERTLKGIQGMMDTYEAQGSLEQEQSFGLGVQIIQLEGKTAVIKKSVEEVSVRVTDLKEYTEAQFVITADQILQEVTRATIAEAAIKMRADEIDATVKNFKEDTEAQFRITAGQILNKVSLGEVSSQLSIEPYDIILKTNRLSWESNYSSMTKDGVLTCRNINAINGSFSGNLESETFYANDSAVGFGDYYVSADGSNVLRSTDGTVVIQTARGGPFGKYAAVTLSSQSGTTIVSDHHLETPFINARKINGDCELHGDNWWSKYTLFEALDWLYDKIRESRV
jgi:hypothetical protein